jgi:RNA polymerase sigma-70 factor (ECF subfamily)
MIRGVALQEPSGVSAPMPDSMPRPRGSDVEARFRRMVAEQFDFIWRALRGLGVSPSSVDDAAQQVFLVAAQKMNAIEEGSERSFLFSTARGVAANARRARARNRELADDETLTAQADTAPDPEELTASKRAREVLDAILASLPEDVRSVFILYELEGMTMAEIAETCDLPSGTVASRLRRAREEFQAAARRYQAGGKR